MIQFTVVGQPVPKQSFRYAARGSYQPKRIKDWQTAVRLAAGESYHEDPLSGPLKVELNFTVHNNIRRDLDNLSKGTLDALRKVIYADDSQIIDLHITKTVGDTPGVLISIFALETLTRPSKQTRRRKVCQEGILETLVQSPRRPRK